MKIFVMVVLASKMALKTLVLQIRHLHLQRIRQNTDTTASIMIYREKIVFTKKNRQNEDLNESSSF